MVIDMADMEAEKSKKDFRERIKTGLSTKSTYMTELDADASVDCECPTLP